MKSVIPALLVVVLWPLQARAEGDRTFLGKTVEVWRGVLRVKASTADERRQAAIALGCFREDAKAAVPDLIGAVRQGVVRDEAVDALVQIGSGAEVTVPVLIERFRKRGCAWFTGAGTILGWDSSIDHALARVGEPAVPALIEILNGPDRRMRVCAADVLGMMGPAARASVPSLMAACEHPDADEKRERVALEAVRSLGRIGPGARGAVPLLNRLLDADETMKDASIGVDLFVLDLATALDRLGDPPVKKLLDAFLRKQELGWEYAAQLARFGPRATAAIPGLRAALSDKRLGVRLPAAVALASIAPSAPESIPVLIEALDHPDDEDGELDTAACALGELGPSARAALPALIRLVGKRCDVEDVYRALARIDPEASVCIPPLISALNHESPEIVDVAANCLGLLGPRAKAAVAPLAAVMTRDFGREELANIDPQVSAARALGRIGSSAKAAVPALIRTLKYRRVLREGGVGEEYRDPSAAVAAAEVLGSLGSEAKAAIPALIGVIQAPEPGGDADWRVRRAAILALGRIGPDAKPAIPALRNLIDGDRKRPRYLHEAIAALSRMAPDGKDLAEKWLAAPSSRRVDWQRHAWGGIPFGRPPPLDEVQGRALILGVMGRTSVEVDCLTRSVLQSLDSMFAREDSAGPPPMYIEDWFETLGRLAVGARLAIPRLTQFRDHPDPWVRMWAADALKQISD